MLTGSSTPALEWIQEGRGRCQQGDRGEAQGDPGRWQEVR